MISIIVITFSKLFHFGIKKVDSHLSSGNFGNRK